MTLRRVVLTRRFLFALLALVLVSGLNTSLFAQQENPPKVEIFGGYSWYNPGGDIAGVGKVPSIPKGWGAASTFNVNRWVGFTADFGGHYKREANVSTFLFGPRIKYHTDQFSPFAEILFGFSRISPAGLDSQNAFAMGGGGGFDITINKWVSFRLLQADYIYTSYKNKSLPIPTGTRWDGARIQSGLVLNLGGGAPPIPPTSSCSAQPTEIMAGEPVTVTISTQNFNPKRTVTYSWSATGGKVAGTSTTTTVDTAGLAPGSYTVTGTATDNGKGKNQMSTSCNASFTVKEPPKNPPTMTCSANPTTVKSGDPSTISCSCTSPDGRPVQVAYQSTGGRVSGSGASATLDTAGAPAGPITVNATCTDDRGLSTSGTASVNVEVPPPPPTASRLNEINFPDKRKPARVDNAAKAILDDVALRLQRDADAKAVIIGQADADEAKKTRNLAAMRAINTREYLVKEKGIDPTRLELRTGTTEGTIAEIWIVPTGATFDEPGTTVVDEAALSKKPARKR